MSSRNDRAWASYDSWLLKGSGVDDPSVEVFETEKYKLFSTNEDNVAKFDDLVLEVEKLGTNHNCYNKESYDSYDEFFQECIETFQDELNLHSDENSAEMEFWENVQEEKEWAAECKADQQMQARKDGEI